MKEEIKNKLRNAGFSNNNCFGKTETSISGCVKGGIGYWQNIQKTITMKEDIKDKLRNAGFNILSGENIWSMKKVTKSYKIYINPNSLRVVIHSLEDMIVLPATTFKDLNELRKICYPFNGCKDLDFEKKDYTWEDCVKPGGYYVSTHSIILGLIEDIKLTDEERNLCPTKTAAISIHATTQLMQICAKINEDFEPEYGDAKYYPVLYNGNLDYDYSALKFNQFPMNSEDAVMALIESNPDLLKQYFEANEPNRII